MPSKSATTRPIDAALILRFTTGHSTAEAVDQVPRKEFRDFIARCRECQVAARHATRRESIGRSRQHQHFAVSQTANQLDREAPKRRRIPERSRTMGPGNRHEIRDSIVLFVLRSWVAHKICLWYPTPANRGSSVNKQNDGDTSLSHCWNVEIQSIECRVLAIAKIRNAAYTCRSSDRIDRSPRSVL